MRRITLIGSTVVLALAALASVASLTGANVFAQSTQPSSGVATKALTHTVKDIDGKDFDLSSLKGKAVLIVNVASRCGNTPQYEALEALYTKYKDQGLVIVGFPANNFGGQEPGTEEEIKAFCTSKYNVTFPMMSKVSVKGADKSEVYKDLTEGTGAFAGDVDWNFAKFLIARDGTTLVNRFAAKVKPNDPKVVAAIEAALAAK